MKKHKGITLVELLGAIAIFAIASTIITMTISFIINANKDIIETSQASTTGTLIIRQIENALNDISITSYDLISSDEVILYSNGEFIFNEDLQEIVFVEYDPELTFTLEFTSDVLLNDIALDITQFSVDTASRIEIIDDSITTKLVITVVLISEEGNLYTFMTNLQLV
ncbi:MAG: type II secretion system GspH family protein [Acholeplasmataceae bacterium]|nr:type II secretion system GspH family protein [Acholeplasmataceae bacterium]